MLTTQEKQKYCNILKVGLNASQEEITKAYKKMALKYHPDRNHGNEEWAKQKFQEVGEAHAVLSGKIKPESSNKFSSDDAFKEWEERFNEWERESNEYEENRRREDKAARSKAIRDIEEALTLSNVSISELDSSLWSPYSDWKEKVENSVGSGIDVFSGDMRIDINRAKWAKIHNSSSGQGGYTHGNYSGQNRDNYGKHGDYGNPPPNFYDKNFSPNNSGQTGENKSSSTEYFFSGDKIAKLRDEIEWNKQCLLKISSKSERQRCQGIINELEEELRSLEVERNDNSSNTNDNNNRNEKAEQLRAEIEQLKGNKPQNPLNDRSRQENERKLAEKEQELSELEKGNEDNTNNLNQEELISELINEIRRSKKKGDLSKKFTQLEEVMQQLVKEIQELRTEIKELKEQKERGNLSEYDAYYLVRQESQLREKEERLEQFKRAEEAVRSIINEGNNNNNNEFPTGLIIGGGVLLVIIGLITFLIIKLTRLKK